MMSLGQRVRVAFLAWLVALGLGACAEPQPVVGSENELFVASRTVWPAPFRIPVCWEAAGNDAEKNWVREQITNTWQAQTGATFVGWDRCAADTRGIRIRIADERPSCQLGRQADGQTHMILNFQFGNFRQNLCQGDQREACIRNIAVHEFGHALGFSHEQNRDDRDVTCTEERDQFPGDDFATPYDPISVMNYCNPVAENGGVLSPRDVDGARKYYGMPTNGDCRLLAPREFLRRGQRLRSCDAFASLVFEPNGNLVLYGTDGRQKFASNTGADTELLHMQPDGNLVLYDAAGRPVWRTDTHGNPGAQLVLQNDDNLVVYSPGGAALWNSNTKMPPPSGCGVMRVGQVLSRGESFASCNGRLVLTLRPEGNLVLVQDGTRQAWESHTEGGYAALVQPDGNFVLYDLLDRPLFASNTEGNPGAQLVLQNDNNMVVYSAGGTALWASNTELRPPTTCRDMFANQLLRRGERLGSCNGVLQLTLQTDGNLVVYDGPQALWASNTTGSSAYAAILQTDGNFVLYGAGDSVLFQSGTPGNPGAVLSLQNDGNLVLYNAQRNRVLWTTNKYFPPPAGCRSMVQRQSLGRGQSLRSCNGRHVLTLEPNGNLILRQDGARVLWSSNTAGSGAYVAVMQHDGNLVLYRLSDDAAVWWSGTSGHPGAYLAVQNDANMVLYAAGGAPLWASNTEFFPPTTCRDMFANQLLRRGERLRSCNGVLQLTLQTDGNLVVYDGPQALWASNTTGSSAYAAILQPDGNFVLYGADDSVLWSTATPGNPGAVLSLQNDGNVVLYNAQRNRVLWTTNKYFPPPSGCYGMYQRHSLGRGQSLRSCNGRYTLTMQHDGNLVLYDGTRALWASNTYGSGAYVAVMQHEGNFVMYRLSDDAPVWSSGTYGHPGAYLAMQSDGNLVVYSAGGTALWASNTVQ